MIDLTVFKKIAYTSLVLILGFGDSHAGISDNLFNNRLSTNRTSGDLQASQLPKGTEDQSVGMLVVLTPDSEHVIGHGSAVVARDNRLLFTAAHVVWNKVTKQFNPTARFQYFNAWNEDAYPDVYSNPGDTPTGYYVNNEYVQTNAEPRGYRDHAVLYDDVIPWASNHVDVFDLDDYELLTNSEIELTTIGYPGTLSDSAGAPFNYRQSKAVFNVNPLSFHNWLTRDFAISLRIAGILTYEGNSGGPIFYDYNGGRKMLGVLSSESHVPFVPTRLVVTSFAFWGRKANALSSLALVALDDDPVKVEYRDDVEFTLQNEVGNRQLTKNYVVPKDRFENQSHPIRINSYVNLIEVEVDYTADVSKVGIGDSDAVLELALTHEGRRINPSYLTINETNPSGRHKFTFYATDRIYNENLTLDFKLTEPYEKAVWDPTIQWYTRTPKRIEVAVKGLSITQYETHDRDSWALNLPESPAHRRRLHSLDRLGDDDRDGVPDNILERRDGREDLSQRFTIPGAGGSYTQENIVNRVGVELNYDYDMPGDGLGLIVLHAYQGGSMHALGEGEANIAFHGAASTRSRVFYAEIDLNDNNTLDLNSAFELNVELQPPGGSDIWFHINHVAVTPLSPNEEFATGNIVNRGRDELDKGEPLTIEEIKESKVPYIDEYNDEGALGWFNFDSDLADSYSTLSIENDSATWKLSDDSKFGEGSLRVQNGDGITQVEDHPDLNDVGPWSERTVSLWFKLEEVNDDGHRVVYQEGGSLRGFHIYVYDHELFVGGWDNVANSGETEVWAGTWHNLGPVDEGEWTHVALVLDIGDNVSSLVENGFRSYRDGALVESGDGMRIFSHYGPTIGLHRLAALFAPGHPGPPSGDNAHLRGYVDDLAIWNRALLDDEIEVLGTPVDEAIAVKSVVNPTIQSKSLGNFAFNDGTQDSQSALSLTRMGATSVVKGMGFETGALHMNSSDDYAVIGSSPALNGAVSKRSVSAWFMLDEVHSGKVLYEQGGRDSGLNIYIHEDNLYAGAWDMQGTPWTQWHDLGRVEAGEWTHVSLVLDVPDGVTGISADALRTYRDGQLVESSDGKALSGIGADTGVGLGGISGETLVHLDEFNPITQHFAFRGYIDDLVIANEVFSDLEIAILGLAVEENPPSPASYIPWSGAYDDMLTTFDFDESFEGDDPDLSLNVPAGAEIVEGSGFGEGALRITNSSDTVTFNADSRMTGAYSERSISTWFMVESITGRQVVYAEGNETVGMNIYVDASGHLIAGAWDLSKNWFGTWHDLGLVNPGQWTQVAIALNETLGEFSFGAAGFSAYRGGDLIATGPGMSLSPHGGAASLGGFAGTIRYRDGVHSSHTAFDGYIDDFAIWTRALSDGEVSVLGRGESATPELSRETNYYQPQDLALLPGINVSQSSVDTGEASNAIDGYDTVASTLVEKEPWWELLLPEYAKISDMSFYFEEGREADHENFKVLFYKQDQLVHIHSFVGVPEARENIVLAESVIADRVRVTSADESVIALRLMEVEFIGVVIPSVNLAQLPGAEANQSSLYYDDTSKGSWRAIDGNPEGSWHRNEVVATNTEVNPWWEVSLPNLSIINHVNVHFMNGGQSHHANFRLQFYKGDNKVYTHQFSGVPEAVEGIRIPEVIADRVRVASALGDETYLRLAEVKVTGSSLPNLALSSGGANAEQSTTAHDGFARLAIDGNTDGVYYNGSVTHTGGGASYWEVTLPSMSVIDEVILYNRFEESHRLSNFLITIYKGDTEVWSHNVAGPAGDVFEQAVPPNIVGDQVHIKLNNGGYLSLAEVEVYGLPVKNLSLLPGAVASQSDTYFDGFASKAIDGDTNPDWANGSVSHTDTVLNAYWEVQLPSLSSINSVNIHFRDFGVNNHADFKLLFYHGDELVHTYQHEGTPSQIEKLDIAPALLADRVQIAPRENSASPIMLAEVEVIGVPRALKNLTQLPGVVAEQSSLYFNQPLYGPSKAIDGEPHGLGRSGAHAGAYPYWEVFLPSLATVSEVKVYFATNNTAHGYHHGDFLLHFYQGEQIVHSYQFDGVPEFVQSIILPDVLADRVRFASTNGASDASFTLAEVEVYGSLDTASEAVPESEPVQWRDLEGVALNGTTLSKTAVTAWGNGGASSVQVIGGDGGVEVEALETHTYRMFGLSSDLGDANWISIDYAFYLLNGQIHIYENGAHREYSSGNHNFGTYSVGDIASVERFGDTIYYKLNGNIIYVSSVKSTADLKVDTAFYSHGATLVNPRIFGVTHYEEAPESVQWVNLVGTAFNGSELIKISGDGWGNSEAASLQIIGGDGGVEAKALETHTNRMFGLSADLGEASYAPIDYGLYLAADGMIDIWEQDYLRADNVSAYQAGDIACVERVGEVIYYKLNGNVIYESTVASRGTLRADATFYNLHARLGNPAIFGTTGYTEPSEPVEWTELVGTTFNGTTLRKTAGSAWGNGGASSVQVIGGDGWVEVTALETDTDRIFGLSAEAGDAGFHSIDYAVHLGINGGMLVRENGEQIPVTTPTYTVDSVISIERIGFTIYYKLDGETFYTSTVPSTADLRVDASLHEENARLSNPQVFGVTGYHQPFESVYWTDIEGAAVNGETLIKTTASGWGNSGASSVQIIGGDGGIEVEALETNANRMFGLSADLGEAGYDTIDYGFNFTRFGTVNIFENGDPREYSIGNLVFGTYQVGDIGRVERIGDTIYYKLNGEVLYESLVKSTTDLMVDAALDDHQATFGKPRIFGATQERVQWANRAGTALSDEDTLTKILPHNGWDAGATSLQIIGGDGGVEVTALETDTDRIFGLSAEAGDAGFLSIDYAVQLGINGGMLVRENGEQIPVTTPTYTVDSVISIERIGFTIYYKLDGETFYTSTVPSTADLMVDISLNYVNATLGNPQIFGVTSQRVQWTDLEGVAINDETLSKTTASGWGNSGASSVQVIGGDGWVEVEALETNANRMFGLSADLGEAGYDTIDYGFNLTRFGTVNIFENGAPREYSIGNLVFGTYREGNTARVERIGDTIYYKLNGEVLYESPVKSTADLMVDTAFDDTGATLVNPQISGVTRSRSSDYAFIVGSSPNNADYNSDGAIDVWAIKKNRNASNRTEVHVLNGAVDGEITSYHSYLKRTPTAHQETDDTYEFDVADYNADGYLDLWVIKKSDTGSNTTEIHILDGASGFQYFLLQTGTAQHETDENYEFHVADYNADGSLDLWMIKKRHTGSNSTEIHILDGASGFQYYLVQTPAAHQETDNTYEFDVADYNADGYLDLWVIKKSDTGTNTTEIHILDGASGFQYFLLQTGTAQYETDENYEFHVSDYNADGYLDLWMIYKRHTGTESTEIHVLDGSSANGFQTFLLHSGSAIEEN